ncbi:tubulin-specific chaperone A-like [Drosophila pseudoobscura]|uniref:Tubulin-specific chaperone A n=1 Tax=Drosophila pseudoobscura pseudoobscura TaxID=46245 RepID=A0A6I8UA82_DROPS|nr:tubulin-specific chaperone A [Drosophila pseudoobscura]
MYCPRITKPQANDNRPQAKPKPKPKLESNQRPTTYYSGSDPRLEQLVVYRSLLEHLLDQKIHYDRERKLEEQRLERFRREGLNERSLMVQERVLKKTQAMLPGIVFKMRNEVDRLQRLLETDQKQLRQLDLELFDQCQELVSASKQSLDHQL